MAAYLGVKRVIMLGYDMQHTGGKTHWHGDHPKGLANAGKVNKWPVQFDYLKNNLGDVEIINASSVSALTCFKRVSLDEALA
ncbi:hypothetical protein D0C16_05475 [Cellvibrio sp. KY-GH-1]|nr:hypothetical protein D0C16_05475 [Cellvibrio sp. KY-GH-1]